MRWWLAIALAAGCGDNLDGTCRSWLQWGGNAAHDDGSCVRGQPLTSVLADVAIDPFVAQEVAEGDGDLFLHYQAPLVTGDLMFTMAKAGTFTPCVRQPDGSVRCAPLRLDSQVWIEQAYRVVADTGTLEPRWSYATDWKPVPFQRFEPMFQGALTGDRIVLPAGNGGVWELDQETGAVRAHYEPFAHAPVMRDGVRVAGGIAVGPDGTLYYSAMQIGEPTGARYGSWLVAIAPDGTETIVDYATLVPDAPAADAPCFAHYFAEPKPWPPQQPDGSVQLPQQYACGAQRPQLNLAPAIGPDGTVFVATHAAGNGAYGYVVALDHALGVKWATSLRDHLHDGCGGLVAPSAELCPPGTPAGVDPFTGLPPAGEVDDNSSGSPVALPDGGVLYGAYTGYNGSRGHLFRFDAGGAVMATYDFGWDTTPSVIGSGADMRIITKDNHYGRDANGVDLGPYYITALDGALDVVWQAPSTNTQSCARGDDGAVTCVADHPNGFEWCVNAVAVDRDGTIFANSEDGYAYAFTADGRQRDALFLDQALGAAYTPVALDPRGRTFTLNSGHLLELGVR